MTLLFRGDDAADRAAAADLLRTGHLVAFPTETVYGLGANAFDSEAVRRIFAAKRRPANHPLIVHIAALEQVLPLVSVWPEIAQRLADAFWPGPLTLVLPRSARVPDATTGGIDSVAVRIPNHPIALELLRLAAVPVAAPSANPHTRVSPTTAKHVLDGLGDRVDAVVDGGPCAVGIESTVLSLLGSTPHLLRPGGISRSQIEAVIGPIDVAPSEAILSPGQAPLHYSPTAKVQLVDPLAPNRPGGRITFGNTSSRTEGSTRILTLPVDPEGYAAGLYAALHTLDREFAEIAIDTPPETPPWDAVWDRLRRAAGPRK